MPCDTKLKQNYKGLGRRQTISERKTEIVSAIERLSQGLAAGRVRPVVGPQGAITFQNWTDAERDDVTDACAYRQLMVHGSAFAKKAVERAELLAGRKVDRHVVGHGVHSHDGGATWHGHKG